MWRKILLPRGQRKVRFPVGPPTLVTLLPFLVGATKTLSAQGPEEFYLRASLCKILISSFAHKMDFAHNFSVGFFNKYITNMKLDWRNSLL